MEETILTVLTHAYDKLIPILPMVLAMLGIYIGGLLWSKSLSEKLELKISDYDDDKIKSVLKKTALPAILGIFILSPLRMTLLIGLPIFLAFESFTATSMQVLAGGALVYGLYNAITYKKALTKKGIDELKPSPDEKISIATDEWRKKHKFIIERIVHGILSACTASVIGWVTLTYQSIPICLVSSLVLCLGLAIIMPLCLLLVTMIVLSIVGLFLFIYEIIPRPRIWYTMKYRIRRSYSEIGARRQSKKLRKKMSNVDIDI